MQAINLAVCYDCYCIVSFFANFFCLFVNVIFTYYIFADALLYRRSSKIISFSIKIASPVPKNYDTIKDKWRFKRISSEGKKYVCKSLVILCYKREKLKPTIGIAASKKTYKLAVHRNKAKRRIKAMINEASKLYDLSCYDLFFIVRRGMVERNYNEVKKSFCAILGRITKDLK